MIQINFDPQKLVGQAISNLQKELKKSVWDPNYYVRIINENLPKHFESVIDLLARNGWFISVEYFTYNNFTRLSQLDDSKDSSNIVDIMLVTYTQEKVIPNLLNRAKTHFPDRIKILKDGLEAHSNRKYTLSVPVFLAQADGMFSDIFKGNLFVREKNIDKKIGKKFNKQDQNNFFITLGLFSIQKIISENSLNESYGNIDRIENRYVSKSLNRHTVLHGKSVDYDTHINSLKAISLVSMLAYISEMTNKLT